MPRKPPVRRGGARLDAYRGKRDFTATPEPPGGTANRTKRIFVIQEHHARSHHFDLRLEMNGVLASWAVPKGIPEETSVKRLAIHVEDHPLDYAGFEGEIPKGHYGAGTVTIWDKGDWTPAERHWRKTLERGTLKFHFHGRRLDGPYLLARMGGEPNWLLRKLDPDACPDPRPASGEQEPCAFVPPQLAKPMASAPQGEGWLHEIKYDGYRIIAVRRAGEVRLFTRKGLDWTDRFGGLARRLEGLEGGDFVLDGEAVVFDAKGRSSFGDLQDALGTGTDERLRYVAFDLLHDKGRNLRKLPLSERLDRLAALVPADGGIIFRSRTWTGDAGPELLRQACESGLEGIISKRIHGIYRAGERRDWVKSKCRPRQEFIVCGYTEPQGACPGFGALLLASMEKGKLVPRGKVGTGFTDRHRLKLLSRMKPLAVSRPPFPSRERNIRWLRPELVVEVEFAELTRDGAIRQGSFISLRDDKPASDVQVDPMEASAGRGSVVAGIPISHPDRVVFPEAGVTKLEVARYYERIGDLILPHVIDRPLALLRTPEGIAGEKFFQKSFKARAPEHVKVKTLDDGTDILFIRKPEGLVSLAQLGVIELHPWGSRLPRVDKPDVLVWDLDPDKSVPWEETLGAAFLLRDILLDKGLETRVKTSGGKGLHVMLHLKRRHPWDVIKPFTKAVAARVAQENPRRLTIHSSLGRRGGKIYIDWLRNGRGATCIAPWALRARPLATVSMPLDWEDLSALEPEGFTVRDPVRTPASWQDIDPQHLPVALIREMTLPAQPE